MKIIIAKIWLHNSQWSKRKEKEMHVICFHDWFEKWNNSELWLLLGIRNIMIILMMMMMMLMILITMIIHHDENEISYNTRLMYVNFFIYTCRLRGDIFEKISKMINQQQSNFAFWPPDKKITNWKKKSKCHDRTPCVLMYDLWCPEFTVRNDAVSYRISLMSNQKAYANRQQTPTVSMNALDHNFVIEKVTNIITARHIISMRELFLFSLSLSFCYHYCKYGENLILSISLWLLHFLQPIKL